MLTFVNYGNKMEPFFIKTKVKLKNELKEQKYNLAYKFNTYFCPINLLIFLCKKKIIHIIF